MTYTPGPGDMLGQYAGHPHDPRTQDDGGDDTTEEAIFLVRTMATSAARAYREGKPKDAERFLVSAKDMLNDLLGQKREQL